MSVSPAQQLEQKIDDLIELCTRLNRENSALTVAAVARQAEQRNLLARNKRAHGQVAALLEQLKSMEWGA